MGRLIERFFPSDVEPSEDAAKERQENVALISLPAYKRFKDYLHSQYEQCRPLPGKEHEVNYTIGLQNGISLVLNHLNQIENAVKESDE